MKAAAAKYSDVDAKEGEQKRKEEEERKSSNDAATVDTKNVDSKTETQKGAGADTKNITIIVTEDEDPENWTMGDVLQQAQASGLLAKNSIFNDYFRQIKN